MDITREGIEKRLAQLKAEQAQVQTNLAQLQANLQAYAGAIQDCEFWLSQIDADPAGQSEEKQA
jgi:regulator of sirC expression with transglutaminase-like and TPR domain